MASLQFATPCGFLRNRFANARTFIVCALVLVALISTVAIIGRSQWATARNPRALATATVVCGPLDVKVVERGTLESAANVTVVSDVEGSAAIIRIVDEGTPAKKGDLLVELDSSALRSSLAQQEIQLKTLETSLDQLRKAVDIQHHANESIVATYRLRRDLAQLDLEKYKNGQYTQQTNTLNGQLVLAEEDYTRALESYQFTKRLSKKGYATSAEVEAERMAVTKAEIGLNVAKDKLRVLKEFDYPRQIAEKGANAQESIRELKRAEQRTASALLQARASVDRYELAVNIERAKFQHLQEQINACLIYAPQDGMVVYANDRNGRNSSEAAIQIRAQVRQRQPIIHLPDLTRMQVNARVHESKINLVEVGLPVRIRVDALPGKVFEGKVDNVSLVPLSSNWPNINLKEYSTIVGVEGNQVGDALKPGLTAEVEVLVERLNSVLQLPTQCIVERGKRHFAFVLVDGKPVRRELVVGRSNEVAVQIKDGLIEGDVVVQNPRSGLESMLAELERDIPADSATTEFGEPSESNKTAPTHQPNRSSEPSDSAPKSRSSDTTMAGIEIAPRQAQATASALNASKTASNQRPVLDSVK